MYEQTIKNVIFGLQSHHRAVIYLIASVCLSNFCDFTNKSESYFAKQNNILNIYFVKYSWGWTLLSLGLYLLAKAIEKARIEGDFNNFIKILLQTSARLLIATLVWYLGTEFFILVEEKTGVCVVPKYLDKNTCKEKGYFWKS